MKRVIIIIPFLILPLLEVIGQPIIQKTYKAGDGLNVPGVLLSEDSTYLFSGSVIYYTGPLSINVDAFLMKTDTLGAILWNKTYGGIRNENFFKSIGLPGGNYISAGYTESAGPLGIWDFNTTLYRNILLLKSDVNGNVIQTHCLGDTLEDSAADIIFDGNNRLTLLSSVNEYEFYVTGQMSLMQLDTNLNIQWEKSYSSPDGYRLVPYRIMSSTDGGFYVTGHVSYFDTLITITEVFLMKVDSVGNLQWSKMMGGNKNAYSRLLSDSNNGVYIAFTTSAYGSFMGTDFVLAYFDSSGNSSWAIRYGWLFDDPIDGMSFSHDTSSIMLSSFTRLINIDLSGSINWNSLTSSQYSFYVQSSDVSFNGGWIFTCNYQMTSANYLGVAQIDSVGNSCLSSNYFYPSQAITLQTLLLNLTDTIAPLSNLPIMLTTVTIAVNDSLVCHTYSSIGEENITSAKNDLIIFPNPCYDELYISGELQIGEQIQVTITNAFGKVVHSFDHLPTTLSMKEQVAGVYIISIISQNHFRSHKFIKL